jgi:seryl-tRNA synthetase
MSVTTIISALQQGSAADLNFVSEMRHGLNEILDDMEDVCHRRGDSLHEIEEEMQDNGHLLRSDLVNEVEALKREKRALTEELDSLRAQCETMRSVRPTTKRNV